VIGVNHPRVGEYAADLLRLRADGSTLSALAGPHPQYSWPVLRFDPGSLASLLAHHSPNHSLVDCIAERAESLVRDSLRDFDDPHLRWCDWNAPERNGLWRVVAHTSGVCGRIAEKLDFPDPILAEAVGMLSHLGWLGVSCVDPLAVRSVLYDPGHARDPAATEARHWGLDADQIRRRMLARMGVHPDLQAVLAVLSADYNEAHLRPELRPLRTILRLAHSISAERFGFALWSGVPERPDPSLAEWIAELRDDAEATETVLPTRIDPRTPEFLATLSLAMLTHRLPATRVHFELENQNMHARQESIRQRDMLDSDRIESLAEFSAGAAHEINNPLAVISGRTQQLLRREEDTDTRRTLEIILRQTDRISSILADLMQFARPDVPQPQILSGLDITGAVRDTLRSFAESSGVSLAVEPPVEANLVLADRCQIVRALDCLVENAIEAAGRGGTVILRQTPFEGTLAFEVIDTGIGPDALQQRHMFDPFYSGSPAGRGRGMGLPTAWKLAKLNGGSVRFLPGHPEGTCFVLRLPIVTPHELERRQSA